MYLQAPLVQPPVTKVQPPTESPEEPIVPPDLVTDHPSDVEDHVDVDTDSPLNLGPGPDPDAANLPPSSNIQICPDCHCGGEVDCFIIPDDDYYHELNLKVPGFPPNHPPIIMAR